MKLYALLPSAVMSIVSVSAAQVETPQSERAPERVLLGVGGTALLVPAAFGFAPSAGMAVRANRVLIMGECFMGGDYGYIDFFCGGAAGAIFGRRWSPFGLAGLGYLVRANGDNRGREAVALTLEAGMVLARTNRGSQIWFGARGFIPVANLGVHSPSYEYPPELPFLSLNLRFWLALF